MTTHLYNKVVVPDHDASEGIHTVDFGADNTFTIAEEADIIVSLKLDDRGELHISPDKDGAAPLYTIAAALRPDERDRKSDESYWQTNHLIKGMKAGTYRLSGWPENDKSGSGSYIFYAARITLPDTVNPDGSITTTAAGALQAQVSLTEHYGAEPDFAYAAGKLKITRDVSGVTTHYAYAPTREHCAAHKLTITTWGAGAELVAAQRRVANRTLHIAARRTHGSLSI